MLSKDLHFSCENYQGIVEKWRSGGPIKEKNNQDHALEYSVIQRSKAKRCVRRNTFSSLPAEKVENAMSLMLQFRHPFGRK